MSGRRFRGCDVEKGGASVCNDSLRERLMGLDDVRSCAAVPVPRLPSIASRFGSLNSQQQWAGDADGTSADQGASEQSSLRPPHRRDRHRRDWGFRAWVSGFLGGSHDIPENIDDCVERCHPDRRATTDDDMVQKSPHSATLAVLHKSHRHNYGRTPSRAVRVLEHSIAGDLFIPCPELWPLPGPPPYEILDSGSLIYPKQNSTGIEPFKGLAGGGMFGTNWAVGRRLWEMMRFLWKLPWKFVTFLVLSILGTWLWIEHRHVEDWFGMQLWRWLLWLASSIALCALTSAIVRVVTSIVEHHFVIHQRVLYFTVALTHPTQSLLQALQTTCMFILLCSNHDAKMDAFYNGLLKALYCICLFRAVCLLTMTLAKGASSYFYKSRYFDDIHDALMKEYYLQRLAMANVSKQPSSDLRGIDNNGDPRNPSCDPMVGAEGKRPMEGESAFGEASSRSFSTVLRTTRAVGKFKSGILRRSQQIKAEDGPSQRPESPVQRSPLPPSIGIFGEEMSGSVKSRPVSAPRITRRGSPVSRGMRRRPSIALDAGSSNAADFTRFHQARQLSGVLAQEAPVALGKPSKPASQPRKGEIGASEEETSQKMKKIEHGILRKSMTVTISDKVAAAFTEKATDKDSMEEEARQLALYIFWNLKSQFDAMHITKANLEPLLTKAQADRCMAFLDLDGDQKVSLQELRDAVIKVYQDRRRLAMQLQDRDTIAGRLESVLSILLHTLSILGYLHIFHVDIASMWFTFSSVLLAMSFVFGNSVRTIYESAIYIFLVHPFDVGDTVVISERMYTVEAINLIVVTLRHIDGSRVYQPISLINTVPLCNLTRSGNKKESMTMLLDYSGEAACHGVLTCLRECVGKYVTANSSKLAPQFNISAAPAENPQKIKVIIRYTFNSKGEDPLLLETIRSELSMAVSGGLHAMGARFTLPPQVIETIPTPPETCERPTSSRPAGNAMRETATT